MLRKLCNTSSLIVTACIICWAEARLLETSVSCDQNNFILSLNFDAPFQGIVYSEEGFSNCVYVNGTLLSHVSYQLKIPLVGCETRINGDGHYENGIIVQENAALLQSMDKKYLLTCIPASSSTPTMAKTTISPPQLLPGREMTLEFGGVTVQNNQSTAELVRGTIPTTDTSELRYTVEVRSGHSLDALSISKALNIGDPISYVVRLQKPVEDSQIGHCWANDVKSSLELSDEHGCSIHPRGNIWGTFERTENSEEVIFINRIKAWAFPTSNEVNIFCNLRVCMSRKCDFSNCSALGETTRPTSSRMRRNRMHFSDGPSSGEFVGIEVLKASLRFRRQSEKLPFMNSTILTRSLAPENTGNANRTQNAFSNGHGKLCVSLGELLLLTGSVLIFLVCTIAIFVVIVCVRQGRLMRARRPSTAT